MTQTDTQKIIARYKRAKAANEAATAELRAMIVASVPDHVSAIEMAELCGMTRGAIYKHLREAQRDDQRSQTRAEQLAAVA